MATVWTAGSGTDFSWNNPANWSVGVPAADNDVILPFLVSDPQILLLNTGSLGGSLSVGGDYRLMGGSLELETGMLRVGMGRLLTLDTQFKGTNGLSLTGGGTLRLNNSLSDYTGVTTISNGTLVINDLAQLGTDTSAIVVSGSASRGFGGGSLVLESAYGSSLDFTRGLVLQGYGPISDRGSALISIGSNTITTDIQYGEANIATGIHSTAGMLTISGDLLSSGTGQLRFGTVNFAGVGSYRVTGEIVSSGNIEKLGGGTLILEGNNRSFTGSVLVTAGSVRASNGAGLGFGTANGALTLGGGAGTLELRTAEPDSFASRRLTMGTSSNATLFLDHDVGGSLLNQSVSLAPLVLTAGSTTRTLTINSRNGYGVTFVGDSVGGSLGGNNSLTINTSGPVTIQGDFWNNTSTTARTMTITTGTGALMVVTGDVLATGADHILTKAGAGTLRILGETSNYTGVTNLNVGTLEIAHFGSINNDAGTVNLGTTTNAATLTIMGSYLEASQTTTNKIINLSGTTGTVSILANQSLNSAGVIFNNDFTATGAGSKTLVLGGTSDVGAANEIRGAIVDGSGTTSLQKTGSNMWVLSGANTFSGATTINNGVLKIQDVFSGTSRDVLSDGVAIGFGEAAATVGTAGGTLMYVGADGEASSETLGVFSASQGAGTIRVMAGMGGTATLNLTSISSVAGTSSVNFAVDANSSISIGGVSIVGLLAGNAYFNGADFAYVPTLGTATLRAPIYDSDVGFVTATVGLEAAAHVQVMDDVLVAAPTSVRSLKLLGTTSPELSVTALLTINSDGVGTIGGILATGGSSTISGTGTVTSGGVGALAIRVNETSDILYLNTPVASSTTGGLTKTGAGTLVIGATNAQTGTTNLLEGTIQLAAGGRLSADSVNLTMRQGTVLDLNGVSIARTLTTSSISIFNGSGTVTNSSSDPVVFAMSGNGGTFNGSIDETNGRISVVKMGTTTGQTFTGISNYTGSTTIGAPGNGTTGSLTVSFLADIGQPSSIGRGDSTNAATNAASLIFGGTTGGLTYTGNASVSINRLFTLAGTSSTAGATITNNGINNAALIFSNVAPIAFSGNANQLFRLSGTSTADNWFYPQLVDNTSAGAVTRFSKVGAGTWILGNLNNTYTGTTTIEDGILQAQDGLSLPTNSGLILGGTTSTTAVFQSSGVFTRRLAAVASAGSDTVSWNTALTTGGAGFAASTDKLVVAIGGEASPTALSWNLNGFVKTGASLVLNSANALAEVEFRNAINLNGASRTIVVNDNSSTFTDFATISGVISNSTGTAGLTKTGNGTLQLVGENTYNGVTSVTAGTLVVNSLGSSLIAGPSSVGSTTNAATTTGAVTLGNATTGAAILQYIGPGEVSDRMIRLNATTGTQQIHADGSGPLVLSNVVNNMVGGAKTLALRGSNTMGNMITSDLRDNGGALSITIDGGATWILTGSNDYSGNTTVSAGALGIGGDGALGAGTLVLSNGNVFAYGADRVITNSVTQSNNTGVAFIGDYSIEIVSDYVLGATSSNPSSTTNNISDGKMLTFANVTADAITAARTWTLTGAGDTFVNGNITSTTAFGLNLSYTGNGTLTLAGANTTGGNTTLNNVNGTLLLTGSGKLGSGNLTVNAGSLFIQSVDQSVGTLTMGNVANTTALIEVASGLTLSPTAITFSGTTTLTSTISGLGTLNLGNAGITVNIADNVNQDVDMAWSIANLNGSGVFNKTGAGNLDIRGISNNNFTGSYQLSGGAILGLGALDNNLVLSGGVYQAAGTFSRSLGTGDNQVQWSGSGGGGFAAAGGDLVVTLSGAPVPLVWGSTALFVADGAPLIFGSTSADSIVTFTHDIDLNGGTRTVSVVDNVALATDKAVLSGVLSSSGGLTKTGNGILQLTAANTFTGAITVSAGTLQFSTVSNNGGAASNLGQGTNGLTLGSGRLQFVGNVNQSTNRAITLTGTGTLDASGTDDAVITFSGAVDAAGSTLNLDGSGYGVLSGVLTQTGTTADLTKLGTGTWRLDAAPTIVDDLFVNEGLLILNAVNAHTGDDLFIRSGTLRLAVNGALSKDMDDLQISGETSGGGVLDIFGTTGSAATDIIVGRLSPNPQTVPDLAGSMIDSVGGGSFSVTTLNVRNGSVSANVTTIGTTTLGGTVSADDGGLYSSAGVISGNLNLDTGASLVLYNGDISGNITFGSGVTMAKHSPNTVTLSGTNTVAGAGLTTINNGVLLLDYSSNVNAKIGNGGLTMTGGTLEIDGNGVTPISVNVGNMILGAAADPTAAVVRINTVGAQTSLQVGTITRNVGSTLRFNPSSSDAHFLTSATNGTSTILGGWATYQMGSGSTLFATISGGEIVGFNSTIMNDVSSWATGADVTDSTGFTGALTGSVSINSLRFDAAVGTATINIGANDIFDVASGGLLITSNVSSGNLAITGGLITSSIANEWIVTHDGAATLTIGSRISGNMNMTKAGTGLMVIDGLTNNSNGTLRLAGGTVRLQGGGAIGDYGAVILDPSGTTLEVMDSEVIGSLSGGSSTNYKNMEIKIAGGQELTINQTASGNYFGNISSDGSSAILTKIGAGALTVTDGLIDLGSEGALNIIGGRLTLDINGNNNQLTQLADGMTVNISNGGSLFIEHNGISLISSTPGRIADNVSFVLNSGGSTTDSLFLRHDQNGGYTELIGQVTFGSGVSSIRVETSSTGTSALAALRAASVSRENQATMVLRGTATQNTANPRGQFQSGSVFVGAYGSGTGTSLPVIPWAIGSSSGGVAASDTFLTTTGAANAAWRPLNLATEYANVSDATSWGITSSSENVLLSQSIVAASGSKAIRSLLVATGSSEVNLTGADTGNLTVQSGGFLFSGTGSSIISGFAGIEVSATAGEYVFHVMGSSASIQSPLVTAGAKLTKSGPGALVLSGNNTAISDVALNEGILEIGDLDHMGGDSGRLLFAGGTLRLGATYSGDDLSTRTITMLSGGGTLDTAGHDLIFANSIGNGGTGGFRKAGEGILTLNSAIDYSGVTSLAGGTLRYGLANALPSGADIAFEGGTLDLGGYSTTLGGITMNANGILNVETDLTVNGTLLNVGGTRTLSFTGGGTTTVNGDVQLANTTTSRTLVLSVLDGGTVIVKGSVINGTASASALQKTGDGLLELRARNAYHGTTTVGSSTAVGGTLKLTGDATLSPGNLTLNNGAVLLETSVSNQSVATLTMGGGPAGTSSLIAIGSGITLTPSAISFSATNNNQTAVIQGDGTLNLGSNGITVTVNNSSIVEVDMSWEMDTVIGSGLFIKAGAGTLDIRGVTNYNFTGSYQINAGAILGLGAIESNLVLNGGVYEDSGTFTRSLGTGNNQVQWLGTGGGGFSARGGLLTVAFAGATDPLVWGSTAFFVPSGAPLIFGSTTADDVVDFTHDINLNGAARTIQVVDNPTVTTDKAVLSGDITGGTITKTGNGTLQLSGTNSFTGPIIINGQNGTLEFSSEANLGGSGTDISLQSGYLSFVGDSSLTINNVININPGTDSQTVSLQNLAANGTNDAVITFAGAINTGANILTLAGSGAGVISSGIVQTGTAADVYVTSGTWTLRGSSTLADDLVAQGPTAVLNLDGTGIISHSSGSSNGLYSRNGAIVNLLADNPFVEPGGLDFILLGDSGGVLPGTLNMNGFSLTTPRLDLGQVGADLTGVVTGSGTLTVNTAINLYRGSVEANLAGAGAIVKNGQGEVLFSGDNSGLNGSTSLINGTLRLNYEDHNTRKIASGLLNLYGGALIVEGSSLGDTVETVASLNIGGGVGTNLGASTVEVIHGSGHSATLNLGDITRSTVGGTVNFVTSSSSAISTSSINPLGLTSLGGWATFGCAAFATIDAGNIVAVNTVAKDNVSSWNLSDNVTDSSGYAGILGASSVNSIVFNAASGSSLMIADDIRFTITSGGILVTANAGSGGISGGLITSGLPVGTSTSLTELLIHQYSSNDFTVTSRLNGNLALTKSGTGILIVDGYNLYTGQTTINAGTLSVMGGKAIGDRSIVNIKNRPDAILDLNNSSETVAGLTGGGVDGGTVKIGSGTLHVLNNSGTTPVFIGVIEGSGTFIKSGANTQELEGNSLDFTGDVIVNRGLLHLDSGAGALPSAATITLNAAELLSDQDQSGNRDRLGNSTIVTLNNTAGTRGLWLRTQSQNAARADTVGGVILGAGHNVIQATNDGGAQGTSQVGTLTITNFSRQSHATALVRGQNLGGGSGIRGRITMPSAPAGSIGGGGAAGSTTITIAPYLIGVAGLAGSTTDANVALELGNSFVTWVSSGEGLRPLNLTTEYTLNQIGYNGLSGVTANNVRFAANPDAVLAGGSKTINALVLDSSTAALTINGDSADALTLASGALLATTTTATNAISLGGFSELKTATNEYIVFVTNAANTLTVSTTLSSQASLTKSGAGTLVLTGTNTYDGGTWFNQGVIEAAAIANLGTGDFAFEGGSLRWGTGASFDITTRSVTLGLGGAIFDTNGNNITFNQAFGNGGLGGFSKIGAGDLTLNAIGNFSGPVSLSAGSLILGVANALPTMTNLTLSGGFLDVGAFDLTLGSLDFLANATIDGAANLTFKGDFNQSTGSRTLTINNTGTTTFDGDLMIITNASTTARTLGLSIGSGATVVINSQITDGSASGALSKSGVGTLVLNSANFYTGLTTLNGGTTIIGDSGALGSAVGALTLTSGTLQGNGTGEKVIARNVSQGGTFVIAGDDKITFTGTWLNNTGSRTLTVDSTGGVELAGQVDLSEHATTGRTLTVNGSGNVIISGSVTNGVGTGNSALTYSGTGRLTLSNANTYGGTTRVSSGMLVVSNTLGSATGTGSVIVDAAGTLAGSGSISGSVTLFGRLSPGNVDATGNGLFGQLTVGTITVNTGSELFFQLGGATISDPLGVAQYLDDPGSFTFPNSWLQYESGVTQHDQLYISNTGAPTLTTTITISDTYLNGYVPQYGDVFQIVDWASLGTQGIGGIQNFNLPTDDWDTSWFNSAGIIIYVGVVPEPTRLLLFGLGLVALVMRRRRSR